MPNLTLLTDRYIASSDAEASDVRLRVRYAREAKMLPNATPGRKTKRNQNPQIEAVHATILLLAMLAGGPQLHAAEAVKSLWSISRILNGKKITFGSRVLSLMEMACVPTLRSKMVNHALDLIVTRGPPYASVRYNKELCSVYHDGHERFRPENMDDGIDSRYPMTIISSISTGILLDLGDVVMKSRDMANKLGVTIDTQECWDALGFNPLLETIDPLV